MATSIDLDLNCRSRSGGGSELLETHEFVELLARSNFSFLQGASHPEEMVLKAKELGYQGLAICDVNGLYGIVRGYQAAEKPSAFDTDQLAFSKSDGSPKRPFQYLCGVEVTPHDASPIVLLPMNKEGYTRICRLLTSSKRGAPKGCIAVSLEQILDANEDLIAFPLPPWKENELKLLQDAFQDRIYLPVTKDFSWESVQLYQQALHLEDELGLSLFATNRPLFHEPSRKPLHDALTCILHKTTLQEARTHLALNSERYLKSTQQIAGLFHERPDLLRRTSEIAARVQFSLAELRYRYPREYLPPGKTATEYLRELVTAGLAWRYQSQSSSDRPTLSHGQAPEGQPEIDMAIVRHQVEHELSVIAELEYEDYFLTLWDICQFARNAGILHQGRGSAANSVVCFALGLTSIDPIKLGLLFERFISRERGEPPDIDIDFEHERREEVIQYIYRKYGAERAAMVCTVITYRSRMAIREIAKVMGIPLPEIAALIKFMGREGIHRLIDAPAESAALAKIGQQKLQKLLQLAREMQGFPRHLGIHTGGFVISHENLVDIVPVEAASMQDRYVIQWNKDDINILGFMKIDVLALGMLSAVRKALELLKRHKGIDWNLAQIPANCPGTYAMIQKADTVGVFQIESRAQMSLLPRLKPRCFYDLVIEVAIVRPGPIQGGMVHPYLKRRSGKEPVTYQHPALKPILGKTLGIPLFQEQIMQIVIAVAGFTPGEADELRRVISSAWKKPKVMEGLRQRLINGMLANGLSREYADQIHKTIEGFSSYGFPESHAASFALITYASCYLKHHHPEIFTCALLNSQPMGFYSPRQLIADAQRHRVTFLPLDVQSSQWDYTLNQELHVRVGFRSIYGVRREHIEKLMTERENEGHFQSLGDLIRRTQLPRASLIRLAAAGALHSLSKSPREALWELQGMSFDPQSLFFGSDLESGSEKLSDSVSLIPSENPWEKVQREYQSSGFAIDSHPLAVLRPELRVRRYSTAAQVQTLRHGLSIRVAGLMGLLQKPPTAKGMCFVSLEDETGLMNIVITPDIYQKHRLVLLTSPLLEIEGKLESRDGVRNIKALFVRPLVVERSEKISRQDRTQSELETMVLAEGVMAPLDTTFSTYALPEPSSCDATGANLRAKT